MGFLVIPGMLLVVNNIDVQYMAGVWVGLASAFLAAVFSTLNKAYIKEADPYTISFISDFACFTLYNFSPGTYITSIKTFKCICFKSRSKS